MIFQVWVDPELHTARGGAWRGPLPEGEEQIQARGQMQEIGNTNLSFECTCKNVLKISSNIFFTCHMYKNMHMYQNDNQVYLDSF